MQEKMMRMMGLRIFALRDGSHILFRRRTYLRVKSFSTKEEEAVRQDKLDFITASKMLFSTPSKPRKFGIDFHLVQFFFACLPSLAVYLVAQYARYDMRKMEAELQKKKDQTATQEKSNQTSSALDSTSSLEESNLNEKMSSPPEISSKGKEGSSEGTGKHVTSDRELQEMKCRLDALEEAIKEIAGAEAKKSSVAAEAKPQVNGVKEPKKHVNHTATIETKGNVDNSVLNVKEGSENKEASSKDNVNARDAVLGPKQKPIGGEESHGTNVDPSPRKKIRGLGLEGNK